MKIKKTVGNSKMVEYINGKARKGYTIHTECGQEFRPTPAGSRGYECGGLSWQSLKELKFHIEAGGFEEDDDEAEVLMNESGNLWDCVHPCAFLVRWTLVHTPESLDTLNKYGWLDENGAPDFAKADREFTRVKNIKESFQDTEPSGE